MNVISTSPSDFDGVTASCSCRVLSRRNDSGIGPCQRFKLQNYNSCADDWAPGFDYHTSGKSTQKAFMLRP